ncbi:hypothetical protein [Sphingomicrobium astaxanthinifaciens]|uniref:hypothetical protein n=1 Tax=Sphingomicrobium astaxanthinifaciens TaxID=1227949 RepID=UPI001FCB5603|nr:hypothetical protein [Sphingomicrobium astaxanthinifaciens]MCJ7421402.1 hypothetical protein [Sphingomicrobium astaxanthinifaciens]
MRHLLATGALALCVAGAAIAGPPDQAREEAAALAAEATAEARGDNAYVCKKFPPKVGSRLGGKRQICKTQQEWDLIETETRTSMQENSRQALQSKGPGG